MTISGSLRSTRPSNRRSRLLLQAQIPYLAATAGVAIFLAIANRPVLGRTEVILSLAISIVATVAAGVIPWRMFATSWSISVAVLDVIAIALLRDATVGALVGVGILIVFPVLWLAYSFSLRVLIIAILGSVLLVAYPYFRAQRLPANAADWGNIVVVPIAVCFIAIAVHTAARQFRTQRRSLTDTQVTTNAVLTALSAGIFVIDEDDHIVLSNEPGRAILGKAGASSLTTIDDPLLVFEDDGVTPAGFRKGSFGRSLRNNDLDDRLLLVGDPSAEQGAYSTTSRSVVRDSGRFIGTVVIAQDVSVFVDAARDREQFLQTISHELRTPLTSIIGYLEVIEDEGIVLTSDIEDELGVIKRNADRLQALVDALLTVAATPKPLIVTAVQLDQLLVDSLSDAESAADKAHVNVRNTSPSPVLADCDPVQFRQVAENLVANAIKYTPAGGTVDVSLVSDESDAVLTVTDSGFGITDSEKPLVFDRFFRGAVARDQAVQGVGVGLTIVKQAAEAHGGSVAIDSTVGTGTTVTVRLPLHAVA